MSCFATIPIIVDHEVLSKAVNHSSMENILYLFLNNKKYTAKIVSGLKDEILQKILLSLTEQGYNKILENLHNEPNLVNRVRSLNPRNEINTSGTIVPLVDNEARKDNSILTQNLASKSLDEKTSISEAEEAIIVHSSVETVATEAVEEKQTPLLLEDSITSKSLYKKIYICLSLP